MHFDSERNFETGKNRELQKNAFDVGLEEEFDVSFSTFFRKNQFSNINSCRTLGSKTEKATAQIRIEKT